MEKNRGTVIAIVAALVVAVISLGVAFAAFSTTLNITGSATVQASSWAVYFIPNTSNTAQPTTSSSIASSDISESNPNFTETVTASGSVEATTVSWSASFKTPGDKGVYTLHVRNNGDYNAKVSGVNLGSKSCTSNSSNETTVCGHIHYGLYTNSTGTTELGTSYTLNKKTTGTIYLIAWLDDTLTQNQLPSHDVVTNTINSTITFQQVN